MKSTASKSMSNLWRIIGLVLSHLQVVSKLNPKTCRRKVRRLNRAYIRSHCPCVLAPYGCMSRVLLIKLRWRQDIFYNAIISHTLCSLCTGDCSEIQVMTEDCKDVSTCSPRNPQCSVHSQNDLLVPIFQNIRLSPKSAVTSKSALPSLSKSYKHI
jgi:hypothetical protein